VTKKGTKGSAIAEGPPVISVSGTLHWSKWIICSWTI